MNLTVHVVIYAQTYLACGISNCPTGIYQDIVQARDKIIKMKYFYQSIAFAETYMELLSNRRSKDVVRC